MSPNHRYYDIVVIGAGLAGLAAAREIVARSRLSLAILEAREVGSNNPSPLTFADVAEANGLEDCVRARYSSFGYHNHGGSIIRYLFNGRPLIVLDYRNACETIYSAIQASSPNVTMINRRAVGFCQDKSVLITLDDGECIEGKIVIDCSGRSQVTDTRDVDHPRYYSHVYGGVFSGLKDVDNDVAYFLLPCKEFGIGGGWLYPLGGSQASFGYATISSTPDSDIALLKENFQRALQGFQPYSDYLTDADIEHVEYGIIPVTSKRAFLKGRIMMVGDAGGMATSWTCMGVEPSLRYGALAGETAVRVVMEDDLGLLGGFQAVWDSTDRAKYDAFAAAAGSFWNGNHYFWEWVIKNDLAYLSSEQVLGRLRTNDHVPNKYRFFLRAARYKIKTVLNRRALDPSSITIAC